MDRYLMAVTTKLAGREEVSEIFINANSFDEACQIVKDNLAARGIQLVHLCGCCVSSANDSCVNSSQQTSVVF